MLKHVVMWKFEDKNQAYKVKEMLLKLKEELDIIKDMEIGINEIDTEASFDAVLSVIFDDKEKLKEYLVHPKHKVISEYVATVRTDRVSVDYTL